MRHPPLLSLFRTSCFVCGPLRRPLPPPKTGFRVCTPLLGVEIQPYRQWPAHSKHLHRTFFFDTITMRSWLLCLCALTVVVSCSAQQYYNNRYENFNANAIVQNDRVLLAYYKCVMDKGPCTRDGKIFKRVLPETISTACGRCSSSQKIVVRELLLGIRSKSEPRFNELIEKYDPDRSNRDDLYRFLATGL